MLLSLSDGSWRGSAPIGRDLVAVITSEDGGTAFAADSEPGDVYAVSLPALRVRWRSHLGGAPFGLLLHDGRLFVSLFAAAAVDELDPARGEVLATHAVAPGPAALALDGAGQVAVAGTGGELAVLGGTTRRAGSGFGVAAAGGRLWTADYERAEIVDDTGARVGLPLPVFPFWLAPGPGGTLLIAAEGAAEDVDSGAVFAFDPRAGSFRTLARVRDPDQVLASGNTILVAAHGDRAVVAIEGTHRRTLASQTPAVGLAAAPAAGLLVVAVNGHE